MVSYDDWKIVRILVEDGVVRFFSRVFQFLRSEIARNIKFRTRTLLNYIISNIRYPAPAKPYKIIVVNSKKIEHHSNVTTRSGGFGQVIGGDWDLNETLRPVSEDSTYIGLQERFIQGKDWEDTAYWGYAQKRGDSAESRCEYVDELYQSIKENGYLMGNERENYKTYKNGFSHEFEIEVHIGRDGEIIINDGHHRCAIGKILNLELPAHVVSRHKKWQELRDDISHNGVHNEYGDKIQNHPDLQDIIGTS